MGVLTDDDHVSEVVERVEGGRLQRDLAAELARGGEVDGAQPDRSRVGGGQLPESQMIGQPPTPRLSPQTATTNRPILVI